MEFYDNVKDGNGKDIDVVPMFSDRQLFKYRYNPYFEEEYEQKEGISGKGDPYMTFTVPVTELLAVMTDGSEITYNLYEKRKADLETKKDEDDLPKLQKTLFPNFEDQFPSAEAITLEKDEEESTSDILQRISLDFLKLAKKLK